MKTKLLIIFAILCVGVTTTLLTNTAYAKGETFEFSGGTDDEGYAGTRILAKGGAFNSVVTFKKISPSEVAAYNSTVDGYSVYYLASSFNLRAAASKDYPNCASEPAFIALKSHDSRSARLYPAQANKEGIPTDCVDVGFDLVNLGADDEYALTNDIRLTADSAKIALLNGYAKVLDPFLTAPKADFLKTCSGRNVNCELEWAKIVGGCWSASRGQAAEIARYAGQGGTAIDVGLKTKELFANCLSLKLNGITAPDIFSLIDGVDPGEVNKGGTDAQNEAEKEQEGVVTPPDDPTTSCNIDGIGWLICPIVTFLANISDGAFGFLADNFLRTDPEVFNTSGNVYQAWTVIRSIANVLFVIVFIIIIFSQLTGLGIANYGVKKMLPRLVIAAILVNISYFVSQLAVDISNILGYAIRDVFAGITGQMQLGGDSIIDAQADPLGLGGSGGLATLVGSVITIVAVGALVYAYMAALIPLLIAAVCALVMILFILIARQAIIILLVVLSPLAFVAFLLPNTEGLFKQWRKLLTAMLLLFPIIALVFGGSSLASAVVTSTFKSTDNTLGQIVGAAILILPLFTVPVLLKKALDGVGSIGGTLNNLGKRAGAGLGGKYKGSDWAAFRAQKTSTRRAAVRAGVYEGANPVLRYRSRGNKRLNNSEAFDFITGGYGSRRGKSAAKMEGKEIVEKAESLAGRLDANGLPMDPKELFDAALKEFETQSRSASDEKKRDLRINLAAAQSHLTRQEGNAGAEYAREQIKQTRSRMNTGTAAPNIPGSLGSSTPSVQPSATNPQPTPGTGAGGTGRRAQQPAGPVPPVVFIPPAAPAPAAPGTTPIDHSNTNGN